MVDVARSVYRQYQELTKTYNRDCEIGGDSEENNGELNPTNTQMNSSSQRRLTVNNQHIPYQNRVSIEYAEVCSHQWAICEIVFGSSLGYFVLIWSGPVLVPFSSHFFRRSRYYVILSFSSA